MFSHTCNRGCGILHPLPLLVRGPSSVHIRLRHPIQNATKNYEAFGIIGRSWVRFEEVHDKKNNGRLKFG